MMNFHQKFNETFCEFVSDLIRVFPEDLEFRVYDVALKTSIALYPTYLAETFHEKIAIPFGEKIVAKDESFFMNHDYSEMLDEHTQHANAMIQRIKSYWNGMTDENKDVVWKYFKVLMLLSKKMFANTI